MDGKTIFCVFFALFGTAVILSAGSSAVPPQVSPGQVSADDAGSLVLVSGRITSVSEKNGNFFFFVCDDSSCVSVPVFSSLASKMPADLSSAKPGRFILVEGIVRAQGEEIAVIPLSPHSIDFK